LSYFLYSLVLAAAMLVGLPYWLYKIARHGKYRAGLAERMGKVPARILAADRGKRVIWIHAVSLGEVLAVGGLVEKMRAALPDHRVLVSTTTNTGQELARKRFGYLCVVLGVALAALGLVSIWAFVGPAAASY
jgi:3-deoxy-D-manno-octulosonic-acid transferase